jgi:hypothetical protein
MWYYEYDHQPIGPVDEATLSQLLREGKISVLTLVWQEGMEDWKHLGETRLNDLARSMEARPAPVAPAANTPFASPTAAAPYGAFPTMPAAPVSRVKPTGLRRLFNWWRALLLIMMSYELLSLFFPTSNVVTALSCVDLIVGTVEIVLTFILLYQFWKVIQDERTFTTPGKAVGFLFIPFFSYYWIFRAVGSLSLEQNRFIDRHFGNRPDLQMRKAHPLLAFGSVVLGLAASIGEYIYMMGQLANMGNLDTSNFSSLMAPMLTPVTLISLGILLLAFLTFYDFYETSQSILDANTHVQQ